MDLDRFIIATEAELYRPATIVCVRAGRKVYAHECSRLVLAASQADLEVCLGCPQGRALAATSPWPAIRPAVMGMDTAKDEDMTAEVLFAAQRPDGHREIVAMRVKRPRQLRAPKPVQALLPIVQTVPTAPAAPSASGLAPQLRKLAEALAELTTDGRLRVSMLDLMRRLRAPNYDATASVVAAAGLRTSRLHGLVETVLMDHNARLLLSRAASEVRQ